MKVRQLMLIGIESSHPGLFLLLNSLVNPHQQSMHALCLNPLILRDLPRSYSPHIWLSWVGLQWNSALDSQGSYYDPQGLIWLNHNNWFCQWGTQIVPLCGEINLSGFFAMDSATTMCLDYSVLSGGFGQFLYCWLVCISTAWVWCNELWESLSKIILCISTDCECLITVPN